ncbi:serine hydrolase [Lyngbya confervoides]|uniref:Serine hydrolase n=1 Tax=Lyngbya confervoides BDU141951 TaxID=1574623 RepID=A0ABD4T5K0_9CYAN|nr:serine hydrolase [Lyngbya confervoides]MCM1983934.1 serine hydrolase [Lyngbya confervoides BDU141951]
MAWFKHRPWPLSLALLLVIGSGDPVEANRLTSWNYDGQRKILSVHADEEFSPQVRLIGSPTRLIVDLPGIKLGRLKTKRPVSLHHVKEVRSGQFNSQTTRLVVELNSGYGLDPKQIQVRATTRQKWSIQLPGPEPQKYLPDRPVDVAVPRVLPNFMSGGTIGGVLKAGDEMRWLTQRLAALHSQYAVVDPSVFVLNLNNGDYADLQGGAPFPAASVIKLPILIAYLQDLDAGKVSLDETLVMRPELVASGSGYMQDLPDWSRFSARYTLTQMIETSDNTATNMIIHRLGGPAYLNRRFQSWGLKDTQIRNWLPDLSGTNTVSSHDLATVLTKVVKGNLLSSQGRQRALYILKLTQTRSLLVPGIGRGASIAHKTGDIGFALGDAGIVFMPGGQDYVISVLLRRPYNDPRGRDYVQRVSKTVYAYFKGLNR